MAQKSTTPTRTVLGYVATARVYLRRRREIPTSTLIFHTEPSPKGQTLTSTRLSSLPERLRVVLSQMENITTNSSLFYPMTPKIQRIGPKLLNGIARWLWQ